jgi:hypothetical protein
VEVGNLEVGNLEVGNMEVGNLEVGNMEVSFLTVGKAGPVFLIFYTVYSTDMLCLQDKSKYRT